ncbi:hypothetical protein KQ302_11245 [Synechococcus sp. CS-602]|uniref:hypothetical protein n=1 Tax=Synechococcaceae TaxID=1890426 RepID=UPI000A4A5DC7|nr:MULTISPECIES: hypothetical protein [Synechococcaceae]MCT4365918.1 hypothetical protein [Candidatus Regnicoccus frigidus MAG-AL1]MCT0201723.1 hypothetical protein [Synechococcus sp. CS-603]MCT0205665.1 hypothetical protein [Synechococcus sp. CS-602]MCT0247026.1 hypothetical protein [Synechococcus sp. CS-601]MCT4366219.1 hypothetical protein [Candidatus Regnicoccus frigidus MAG-AL2]
MLLLSLAIVVIFSFFHAVMEPLMQWGTPLFELRGLIWLPVLAAAWLLAGKRH